MIGLLAWCGLQEVPATFDSALAAMREDGSWLVRSESVPSGRVGAVGPAHSLRRLEDPATGTVLWIDGSPCRWDGREPSPETLFRTGTESCAGHFAAVLCSSGRAGLQAITDPWGTRLLYQVRHADGWLLASDLDAVFSAGLLPRRVDPAYVRTLLRFNKCRLGDRTLLCDVEVLPPASAIRFFPDGRREVPPLPPPAVREECRSEAEWLDRLVPLMRRAVSRSLSRFSRPALALSGGLDSRMLLAAMTPEQRRSTALLTTGNPRSHEVRLAEAAARAAGCGCEVVPLGAEDFVRGENESRRCNEEFDIFVQGAAGVLHRRVAETADALMTGWDVDVELRGTYTSPATAAMRTGDDVRALLERKWGLCSPGELQTLLRTEFQAGTPDPTPDLLDRCLRAAEGPTPEATYLRFIQLYEKRRLLMLRARMIRRRIETLLPFYDPELQLAMRAIPEAMKRGNRLFRALLIALDPALAAVPYQRTLRPASAPPEEWEAGAKAEAEKEETLRRAWLMHRSGVFCERHFSNFDEWLLADPDWDAAVHRLLLDDTSAFLREVVRPEAVRIGVDEHRRGTRNHMSRLVYLMSLASYWNAR
jgi:asparagine synthase (glutamine-hydrolysing)